MKRCRQAYTRTTEHASFGSPSIQRRFSTRCRLKQAQGPALEIEIQRAVARKGVDVGSAPTVMCEVANVSAEEKQWDACPYYEAQE